MNWTDQRTELLKTLWAEGLSSSQIGGELGLTRNAVIGKVHRLGLSGRIKSAAPPPREPKRGRSHVSHYNGGPKPQRTDVTPFKGPSDLSVETHAPAPIKNIIPIDRRCSILELTLDNCHWPIGDPRSRAFFFCGAKSLRCLPYCGYHSRMAYQPEADRRRERQLARAAKVK